MAQQNIRVIFTPKANSALEEIITSFDLQETPEEYAEKNKEKKFSNFAIINNLARAFAMGVITEDDLMDSLQKNLNVPKGKAEKISQEVMTKIIPFLEKIPEERLNDAVFIDSIAEKIWGEKKQRENLDDQLSFINKPAALSVEDNEELLKKYRTSALPQNNKTNNTSAGPQTPIKDQTDSKKPSSGPDQYREPIE